MPLAAYLPPLFAQPEEVNVVGGCFCNALVGLVCCLLPLFCGRWREQEIAGFVGAGLTFVGGLALNFLLAVPLALVATAVIFVLSTIADANERFRPRRRKRKRRRRDEGDEDDEPRDEEADRPRRDRDDEGITRLPEIEDDPPRRKPSKRDLPDDDVRSKWGERDF